MVKEKQVTAWGFTYSLIFYSFKRMLDPLFTQNIFEIATYALVIVSALFVVASINNMRLLYSPLLGLVSFNTLYLGILLAGSKGLGNSSFEVIEGLSRLVLAICAIWKLSSDMRNLNLQINPHRKDRGPIKNLLYGIIYPPKELARLVKVLIYVMISFYLVFTGLDLLSSNSVNLGFFKQTERMSLNILFFGVQTPMMMASRASISKTFSEYIKNLEWADTAFANTNNLNNAYQNIFKSNNISYDAISSNGKHIWFTILLMIILQAYQTEILRLDIFQIDYGLVLGSMLSNIRNLLNSLFG